MDGPGVNSWWPIIEAGKQATPQQIVVEIPKHEGRRFTMQIHCTIPGAMAIAAFQLTERAADRLELIASCTLGEDADAFLSIRAFIPEKCPVMLVLVQTRAGEVYISPHLPVFIPMSLEEMAAHKGEIAAPKPDGAVH